MQKLQMRARRAVRAAQTGFTLLELVIGVAVFTIVVGAVYTLLEVGRGDNFTANQRVEILQNIRVALEEMRRDANNAGDGFWKEGATIPNLRLNALMFLNRPNDSLPDSVGPVVPGDGRRTITVNGAPVATDVVGFVYSDITFNAGNDIGVTAANLTTNTLTIDENVATNTALFTADRLYVIDNGQRPAIGVFRSAPSNNTIRFNSGDMLGVNVTGATGSFETLGTTPGSACRAIIWTAYYVSDEGVLTRRTFGPQSALQGVGITGPSPYPGYVDMPLAFGVENFQVQYVLDSGTAVDDIALDTDWRRVRMVRVTLTVRSPEIDSRRGDYIRETMTSVLFTRNLANQERPPAS